MKKALNVFSLLLLILLPANVADCADSVEYPRYLPPAQTRDEIIREELRRQEESDRARSAVVIRFRAGGDEVGPEDKQALTGLSGYLEAHPEAKATINGFTDSSGSPDANMKLSERRARKVKSILVEEFKIDGARLETAGWGAEQPVASNRTAAGRQKNRRVEAVIGSK